jgi:hypothetical protein
MDFNLHRGTPRLPPQAANILMIPGFGLIGVGVLVIYNEHLLVYMIASLFFLLGGLLVVAGLRLKKHMG